MEINKKGEKPYSEEESIKDIIERINNAPTEELFKLQKVLVKIDEMIYQINPAKKQFVKIVEN